MKKQKHIHTVFYLKSLIFICFLILIATQAQSVPPEFPADTKEPRLFKINNGMTVVGTTILHTQSLL